MMSAMIGICSGLLAITMHGLMARWLSRRAYFRTIPVFGVVAYSVVAGMVLLSGASVESMEWITALAENLSLGFAYALLFMGVAHDSPTLSLISAIEDHGRAGMLVEELPVYAAQHPFVSSRIEALIASSSVRDDAGSVVIGPGLRLLLTASNCYRALCGRTSEVG